MNLINIILQAAAQPQGGSMTSMLVMMLALIAIFYFLMIRPQQKRQKELAQFRNELKKGDSVITIGGIKGKVVSTSETEIIITIAKDVDIAVSKEAIVKDMSDTAQR